MSQIKYQRHFTLLLLASALLWAAFNNSEFSAVVANDRIDAYFASVGLLHATALVLSLRIGGHWFRRIVFVCIATALSVTAPLIGAGIVALTGLQNDVGFVVMLAGASAGGACAYWFLVRVFWLQTLAVVSLLRTVCLCAVATLVSFTFAGILTGQGARTNPIADDLPTVFWWLAFSGSLFLADRTRLANKPLQPAAENRGG